MNILLTSAGRRSYLVNYFKEELKGSGKVFASNTVWTTALEIADEAVLTPLIYDDNYIGFLLNYCQKNNIELLISLFDIDLPVLAKSKKIFEEAGIKVIVSDYEVTQICNDKWKTHQFLIDNAFAAPQTFIELENVKVRLAANKLNFPLIVKPRWGMGSISIFKADNEQELDILYTKVKRQIEESYLKYESTLDPAKAVLIQEFLPGQEYGLDVVNNLDKSYMTTFVKKKTAMRSGETDGAITEQNQILEGVGEKLAKTLKHIANLDVDCFMVNNKPYVLEMNCRFGGGYPFSHLAGANVPGAILKWVKGKSGKKELSNFKSGVHGNKDIVITKINH